MSLTTQFSFVCLQSIAWWCNGSTTGFGPVSRGSNPCRAAILRPPLRFGLRMARPSKRMSNSPENGYRANDALRSRAERYEGGLPEDPNDSSKWWYVYRIESIPKPDFGYKGCTEHLRRRFQQHNRGENLFPTVATVEDMVTSSRIFNALLSQHPPPLH